MSLWGRYVIDRIKQAVSHRVILPVPPYGKPGYWDGVHKNLGPHDVYEWGGLSLQKHLMRHEYRLLHELPNNRKRIDSDNAMISTTFDQVIGVEPNKKAKICVLGCGNSKFGEEMAMENFSGPILQVDVASRVLDTMSQRCASWVQEGVMDFVQDDATQLSAFDDCSMDAVIDKGLVDSLFCANEFDQLEQMMNSVHRVLKPGSIFCVFSFSAPQYIMPIMFPEHQHGRGSKQWQSVQVRELESVLMYRYQKHIDKKKRKQQQSSTRSTRKHGRSNRNR